jgi:ABC-type transport system involved in multi-copper enzyme maturation permease subunit
MNSFHSSLCIALTTFREAMRAKLLLIVLLISCMLIGTVTLFGMVTIGDQIQVLRDFGLTTMSLATVGYISIVGATLLEKELQKKTIFNILSKPVARWNFIFGKFLGLWITVLVVGASVAAITVGISTLFGDSSLKSVLIGLFFIALEGLLLAACVLFFSTILVTPSLAGILTLATFIVGRSSEYLLRFIEKAEITGISKYIVELIYWSIPNFAFLNVADYITFGSTLGVEFVVKSIVYSVGYSGALVIVASIIFERRDFN